jgi:hypothetical protein
MSLRVCIVVLNWNGGAQTQACVESLRRQEYSDKFIVLVDNHSSPAEREDLRRRYGDAEDMRCVYLDDNRGYAGGNNVGIELALAANADLVVIATQDVAFEPGALAEMVAAATAPGVGIVGPKVLESGDPTRVLSIGERVPVPMLCIPRTLLRHRRERAQPYDVGAVLGCAMLLTRPCLHAVAGFDEGFFAYYEEIDLCLRVRRGGFRILCAPRAVVRHDGMRGFAGGFTALSAELKARNLIRLIRRWARPLDYLLLVPTYLLLLATSMALYALRGRAYLLAAMLRGVAAGVQGREGKPRADPVPLPPGEVR